MENNQRRLRVALGLIVKNEESAIIEWIAHHKLMGFSPIVVVDNCSSDGTGNLLKQLSYYEEVETFRFETLQGQAPQLWAYRAILKRLKGRADVVGFIDADELIVATGIEQDFIQHLSNHFADPEVSAMVLNWACFGSSGQVFHEPGLVTERFNKMSRRTHPVNKHYKSFARIDRITGFNSPHSFKLSSGRIIHADGQNVIAHPAITHSKSDNVVWSPFRINHYIVKSLEEFLIRKSKVGSASRYGASKDKSYFIKYDLNELDCEIDVKNVETTKAEVYRLNDLCNPKKSSIIKTLLIFYHRFRLWFRRKQLLE